MQQALSAFVDELRTIGVSVSVGEHLDAARALAGIPLADREIVRSTLQCALVKRAEHLDAFNLLFELHFAGTANAPDQPLSRLSEAELAAALRTAIEARDTRAQRLLAEEFVRRFGGLEPGARVAGVFAMIAASEAADLESIRAELIAAAGGGADGAAATAEGQGEGEGGGGGGGGWNQDAAAIQARLDRAAADDAVDAFATELRSAIRRTLVADRGASAVTKTMRIRLAQDVNIANASAAEQQAMLASIGPLAQRLSKILAQQAALQETPAERPPDAASGDGHRRRAVPAGYRARAAAATGLRRAGRRVRLGRLLLPVHAQPADRARQPAPAGCARSRSWTGSRRSPSW